MTKMLSEKLDEINSNADVLYSVSDMISEVYNPNHKNGITKNKTRIASLLAKRFDLSKEETYNLKIAILLYDIGNMMLPRELLQKRMPLTDDEKTKIKSHPVI